MWPFEIAWNTIPGPKVWSSYSYFQAVYMTYILNQNFRRSKELTIKQTKTDYKYVRRDAGDPTIMNRSTTNRKKTKGITFLRFLLRVREKGKVSPKVFVKTELSLKSWRSKILGFILSSAGSSSQRPFHPLVGSTWLVPSCSQVHTATWCGYISTSIPPRPKH